MESKNQLYYLLEHYYKEDYTTEKFVDEFSRIYNLELDYRTLSEIEEKWMKELVEITNYFSPFEEDFNNFPKFYSSEQDVKNKATEVYQQLIEG